MKAILWAPTLSITAIDSAPPLSALGTQREEKDNCASFLHSLHIGKSYPPLQTHNWVSSEEDSAALGMIPASRAHTRVLNYPF